jgi:hypothetical protein
MIRHPLGKALAHDLGDLVAQVRVIRINAKDLRPALAAGVPERIVDVLKGPLDLETNVAGEARGEVIAEAACA